MSIYSEPSRFCRGLEEINAFSLVEVAVALAIVSFSVLAILGSLSAGLSGNYVALERGSAARTLTMVADSLRAASTTDHSLYTGAQPLGVTWKIGGSFASSQFLLTDTQIIAATAAQASQVVGIGITPPQNSSQPCLASIVTAWPATAKIAWVGSIPNVSNAQGYELLYTYIDVQ